MHLCKYQRALGWFVLVVAIFNVVFLGGQRRTISVITTALRQHFGNETSRGALNWIGTSYTTMNFALMPFITNILIILNRPYRMGMLLASVISACGCIASAFVSDPKYLYFTYSFIHGIGSTLILSIAALVVGEYFDETHSHHVLATTLISGGAYGTLIFGYSFGVFVENYGWRATFCLVAILAVLFASCGVFMFKGKEKQIREIRELENKNGGSEESIQRAMVEIENSKMDSWRKRPIWVVIPWVHLKENLQILAWLLERVILNIMLYSFFMNIVDMMVDQLKLGIATASLITLSIGIGESISFTLGALLGDRIRSKLLHAHVICSGVVISLILGLLLFHTNLVAAVGLVALLGVFMGTGNICLYAASSQICCIHGSIAYTATRMMASVGVLLAPLFSGIIIERYSYQVFFMCQAVLGGIRFILLIIIFLVVKSRTTRRVTS